MEIIKNLFFLLILSIVYIFIKYGPGKEPFERLKNWFNADKKTSKIIRCQKSIQNIRKAGSEGCIEIDDKLRVKLTEFEIGLKSELNKVREEKETLDA